MPPEPLDAVVQRRMQRQRQRDTRVEWEIRRRLHAAGLRYRVDVRPEPSLKCRGDIVFSRRKVVVFVDGCFWHCCPKHGTLPKNNPDWWKQKLASNIYRDRKADSDLAELGWTVLRIWEHETPEDAVTRIRNSLGLE